MGSWERQQICSWLVACPYLYESALRNELPCHGRTYLINSVRLPSGSFCPCDGSTWQLPNCVATTATFRGSSSSLINLWSRTSLTSPACDGSTQQARLLDHHVVQSLACMHLMEDHLMLRFHTVPELYDSHGLILSCSLLPSDMAICRWEHAGVSESQVFSIWLPHAWVASTRSPGDELI
ncbi:hypothetical protein PVAP13_3NG228189 [Panicum virgatum]|uniref:Uncharacterized protein n=1 Tax=Panicum virgatum TaxID=38727 RepID=A0A8T0UEC9_PANVG|nr:hypothetical protein PVAP13_3NG228189 [Panicum virgatum]